MLYRKLLTSGREERIEAEKQPKGLSAKTVMFFGKIDLTITETVSIMKPYFRKGESAMKNHSVMIYTASSCLAPDTLFR